MIGRAKRVFMGHTKNGLINTKLTLVASSIDRLTPYQPTWKSFSVNYLKYVEKQLDRKSSGEHHKQFQLIAIKFNCLLPEGYIIHFDEYLSIKIQISIFYQSITQCILNSKNENKKLW